MKVGDLIKSDDNTGVIVKVHRRLSMVQPLYEIRWLKTNTVATLTKTIMDLYDMKIIPEEK